VPCSGAPGATGQGAGRSQRRDSRRRQSPGTAGITGSKKTVRGTSAAFLLSEFMPLLGVAIFNLDKSLRHTIQQGIFMWNSLLYVKFKSFFF
jgi:hypothetical protein